MFEWLKKLFRRKPKRPPRILVVEDNLETQKTVKSQFELLGCEIFAASTGEEAIAILEKEPDFDVAVLDFDLPGITGPQLFRQLYDNPDWREIKVVGFTSKLSGVEAKKDIAAEWNAAVALMGGQAPGRDAVVSKKTDEKGAEESIKRLVHTVSHKLFALHTKLPEPYIKYLEGDIANDGGGKPGGHS